MSALFGFLKEDIPANNNNKKVPLSCVKTGEGQKINLGPKVENI